MECEGCKEWHIVRITMARTRVVVDSAVAETVVEATAVVTEAVG